MKDKNEMGRAITCYWRKHVRPLLCNSTQHSSLCLHKRSSAQDHSDAAFVILQHSITPVTPSRHLSATAATTRFVHERDTLRVEHVADTVSL